MALLEEAKAAYDLVNERVESAQRRATTLQSAAAIAATLSMSGAGLVLQDATFDGGTWRIAVGVTVFVAVFAFIACGFRATQASVRLHRFVGITAQTGVSPQRTSAAAVRVARAARYLDAADANGQIAEWKARRMRDAGAWLVIAFVALLATWLLVVIQVVVGAAD